MIETGLQVLLQGLLLGGLYGLFALGQSLMFGVMRLTNTAQGDFIVLGAFAAIAGLSVLGSIGVSGALLPWLAGLLLLPLAFGFGYALQRWVLNGTLGKDPLPSLVVTFGLAIVIQNLLLELFSADPRSHRDGGPEHAQPGAARRLRHRRAAAADPRRWRWRPPRRCNGCSTVPSSAAPSAPCPTTRRSPS